MAWVKLGLAAAFTIAVCVIGTGAVFLISDAVYQKTLSRNVILLQEYQIKELTAKYEKEIKELTTKYEKEIKELDAKCHKETRLHVQNAQDIATFMFGLVLVSLGPTLGAIYVIKRNDQIMREEQDQVHQEDNLEEVI